MKFTKSLFSKMFLFAFVLTLFCITEKCNVYAEDTSAPVVKQSTITVSKTNTAFGEEVVISMKVTDKSEIVYVSLQLIGCGEDEDLYSGSYNPSTGMYEFEVTPQYFGLNQLKCIEVADAYGNEEFYYNSAIPYYDSYDGKHIDMSGANINVLKGSYKQESNAPQIKFDTLTVSNVNPQINTSVTVKVKIQDASPIVYTRVFFAYRGNIFFADGKAGSDGYWTYKFKPTGYGKFEVLNIFAEDAFGNMIRYSDRSADYYEKYKVHFAIEDVDINQDMSAAGFYVQSEYEDDNTAPKLKMSSFRFEKRYLTRYEGVKVTFKVEENSALDLPACQLYCAGAAGDTICSTFEYNEKTKLCEIDVFGSFYGTHQIYEIILCDVFGNRVDYVDYESDVFKSFGWDPEEDSTYLEFYSTYYYVGLLNKETGTFVSNSTMDDTSDLKVAELDQEGKKFNKLSEDGYNIKGYFEVDVDGACDMHSEKSKVFFDAPEGFKDGDILRIRHLLKNGKVQTQDSEVVAGKIGIDVNQFSPFVIEVKKSKDKNQFTKGGYIYKLLSSKTVAFVGTTKKTVKSVKVPDTIKRKGKKYKVTAIAPKALKGYKKLTKLTIGRNVKAIGSEAFRNCKKLKTIIIKTKLLTKSKVGKNAFKELPKKVKISVPQKKLASYQKIFTKKGLGK